MKPDRLADILFGFVIGLCLSAEGFLILWAWATWEVLPKGGATSLNFDWLFLFIVPLAVMAVASWMQVKRHRREGVW